MYNASPEIWQGSTYSIAMKVNLAHMQHHLSDCHASAILQVS